jgi:hypothetical protein
MRTHVRSMPERGLPPRARRLLILGLLLLCPLAADAQLVLTGTVTSSSGGVVGADIDIVNALGVPYSLSGDLTGVGGAFSLTILQGPTFPAYSAGAHTIEINPPPGYLDVTLALNLTLNASGGTQNLGNYSLTTGWVIQGQIVDELGVGIPDIDVDITPDSGGDPLPLLSGDKTDANGFFQATMEQLFNLEYRVAFKPPPTPGLPPTTCLGLSANPNCAAGLLPLRLPLQPIFGPTDLGVLTMPAAACLTARLVDINGAPIPGIDTQVTDLTTGLTVPLNKDDSDCLGVVKVLVPLGPIDLLFRDPVPEDPPFVIDYAPVFFEEIIVTGDLDLGDVTMLLGRDVTGSVLLNGAPLAGAEIEFALVPSGNLVPQSNDVTDAAGTFAYWVGDGSYLVEVDPPPLLVPTVVPVRVPFTVSATSTSLGAISLVNGHQVTGRCVDETLPVGLGVASVDVEFRRSSDGVSVEALHENANATGNFAATLPPEVYDVLLYPPVGSGRAPRVLPSVSLASTAAPLGDIVLSAGVSVTGLVTSGVTPVEGATVEIVGGFHRPATTALDGSFGFQLLPGTYDILVTPPAGSLDPPLTLRSIGLSADTILDLDLAIGPDPLPLPDCIGDADSATLSWGETTIQPEMIEVRRDGVAVATLPGDALAHVDGSMPLGAYSYEVVAIRAGQSAGGATCSVAIGNLSFIRGDLNLSGSVNLSDAVNGLSYLFQGGTLACLDAADHNDNGAVNIADVIGVLSYLFTGGAPPAAPFGACGPDPTPDALTCLSTNCP